MIGHYFKTSSERHGNKGVFNVDIIELPISIPCAIINWVVCPSGYIFEITIRIYSILVDQLKGDMRSILLQITANSDFEIEVFESDLDHIHFLIRYVPRLLITPIVHKLKHESTYAIWRSIRKPFLSKHF